MKLFLHFRASFMLSRILGGTIFVAFLEGPISADPFATCSNHYFCSAFGGQPISTDSFATYPRYRGPKVRRTKRTLGRCLYREKLLVFNGFKQSTVSCFGPLGHPPSPLLNLLGSLWAPLGLPLGSAWALLGSLGPLWGSPGAPWGLTWDHLGVL